MLAQSQSPLLRRPLAFRRLRVIPDGVKAMQCGPFSGRELLPKLIQMPGHLTRLHHRSKACNGRKADVRGHLNESLLGDGGRPTHEERHWRIADVQLTSSGSALRDTSLRRTFESKKGAPGITALLVDRPDGEAEPEF